MILHNLHSIAYTMNRLVLYMINVELLNYTLIALTV